MINKEHPFWTIEEDQFISKWARQTGRLDHDQWLLGQVDLRIPANRRDTFIDVGAYIGDHTVAYSRMFRIGYAIEPNPEAFSCLVHNTEPAEGKRRNVVCVNAAIGQGKYTMLTNAENPGANKLVSDAAGDIPQLESYYLNGWVFGGIDYIKIDVEGMELQVLNLLAAVIDCCRPYMLIEQRRCDGNEEAVGQWLTANGYTYEPIQGKRSEQYDLWCK